MAAEDKPTGQREGVDDVVVSITSDDMAAMIRGESSTRDTREPDVIIADDAREPEPRPRPEASRTDNTEDDRISTALAKMDQVERENAELRGRVDELSRGGRRSDREPEVEMVEIPGWNGMKIPKNREHRAIQFTPEMAEAIGFDKEVAAPLEIAANAFYAIMADQFPRTAVQAWETTQRQQRQAQERTNAFYEAYSDLGDHQELVNIVEDNERRRGAHRTFRDIESYDKHIATQVRSRIANTRGISYDAYINSIDRSNERPSSARRSNSRAVTTGTGQRRTGTVSRQQQEIDEL